MGKSKKGKKKASDVDDFFDSTKPAENTWLSGVSAMALDNVDNAEVTAAPQPMQLEVAKKNKKLQGPQGVYVGGVGKQGKRGNKSTIQKKRKAALLEKAVALSEKSTARLNKQQNIKHKRLALKNIY